jgi:PQQ-dependent catabolism-associated CXXCW motif protein
MSRNVVAVAASFILSGCIVQAPPGYWGSPATPYPQAYYPQAYPAGSYAQPAPRSPPAPPLAGNPPPSESDPTPLAFDSPPQDPVQPQSDGDGPAEPRNQRATFADETVDYGIPPTNTLHLHDFDAPTPTHIEGARTITTLALRGMLKSDRPPLLIDVIGGQQSISLPNAVWLRDAGVGRHIDDDVQAWFDFHLLQLTNNDKSYPLVIFCASRMCWLAHNAILRALDLGFTEVYWYRGGRDAWQAAGLPMAPIARPPS